ncbi:MAG: hypothetical protein BalsKO_27910 [Balneolaceae bacterium]
MTESEIRIKYPGVDILYDLLEHKKIFLKTLPLTRELNAASFCEIKFICPVLTCTIPVDDEYEDVESGNQALLLQLVIYMIEEYEDCDDFLIWTTAYGLDSSNTTHNEWYKQLGICAPRIRRVLGLNISGISDYDWQLNAGAAQALREITL